ncbi:MAG: orotidine-5'-phosphate decarboxylase [Kiloniellales bacterium]|nr:orotidine-5'-phosphate decarboxylase [Kiloniellales bacterium]
MKIANPKDRIFVPLDTPDPSVAADLARRLRGEVGGLKLGKEFLSAQGPQGVRAMASGLPLFLDVKFHDIPNTVAGAVRALRRLSPALINVHASGGRAMMEAAAAAAREPLETGEAAPRVLAVTVLTSLDAADLAAVGQAGPLSDQVLRLALLAQDSGLDGVVCSPLEIALLRERCGPDFILLVPGIRPTWAGADDQKRVMSPAEALRAGADYLVIGRPITRAEDPAAAARRIADEMSG